MSTDTADVLTLSDPIRAVCARFREAGHSAWLVGESLFEHWLGNRPAAYQLSTSASLERCLALHATAVPTRLEASTITIATSAGPIDVTPIRNGAAIEADLAVRGFSVEAMAFDPIADAWVDPFGGRSDAANCRLRAVGDADARLQERPLRALRAAALWGRHGLHPDDALVDAICRFAPRVREAPGMSLRWELSSMLTGTCAEATLVRLHDLEVAPALFPRVDRAHAAGLDRLPDELTLRLAWSLRGTRAGRILRRLGFGRITAGRVQDLLAFHPIDVGVKARSETAVRRLLRRFSAYDLEALVRMRELELEQLPSEEAKRGREGLDTLAATIERVHRADARDQAQRTLALRGRDVMTQLGLGPGPEVGEALDFLAELVARDPSQNRDEILRERLDEWAQDRGTR